MGYKWIDHFSVAVKTREEGVATYRDKLGLKNLAPLRESGQGSYVGCLCLDDDDRFLEVLGPTRPDAPVARTITTRGEGFHMIVIVVDSLPETLDQLRAKEVQLVNTKGPGDPYIHPRSAHGALLQIRERSEAGLMQLLGRTEGARQLQPTGYRWLDRVVIVVKDLDQGIATYQDTIGLMLDHTSHYKSYKKAVFSIGNHIGGRYLELVQPLDGGTLLGQTLERRGEGFHMAALAVKDLGQMAKDLKARGVKLIGGEKPADQVFIDPQSAHGALLQLVERP
jgi:catechol 2,3-dioxygenase-like lactoylglutathione lyase family enzyme